MKALMNIFHVIRGFGSLSLARTTQPKQVVVLPKPLVFEIKPLTSYCINHPKLSDLIVYKVPLQMHPWGVNFILVKPQIYHWNFKNFCFCVKKMKCVMKAYLHIGGWWILVSLHQSKMDRLEKVIYFFSWHYDFSRNLSICQFHK
jgi:hypothetical protein